MEESPVDREVRFLKWPVFAAFLGYAAFIAWLIVVNPHDPHGRVFGVLNVVIFAWLLARYLVPLLVDDLPYLARWIVYRRAQGNYRDFQGQRVRVIDGERDTPSFVHADDIFAILKHPASLTELDLLQKRFGEAFRKGEDSDGDGEGEWLFTDEACVAYARGRGAHKLALWLEREVFMPIDNRRTRATGRTYAFTSRSLAG